MIKNIVAVAVLTLGAASAPNALAHAKLISSEPKAASELNTAPKEIRLQFNEVLEPAFSKVKVLGASNVEIPIAKIDIDRANAQVMVAPLPLLPAGDYRVQWSTMTHDGHKTKGEFSFKVK